MYETRKFYTDEVVSKGHPDSALDLVGNYIQDQIVAQNNKSRFALDGLSKDTKVFLGGEITTDAVTDYEKWVKDVYKWIGYEFEPEVITEIHQQSPDIAQGTSEENFGASDQGVMCGSAIKQGHESFLTLSYVLAAEIIENLFLLRKSNDITYQEYLDKSHIVITEDVFAILHNICKSDQKSQVSISTLDEHEFKLENVIVACQHEDVDNETYTRWQEAVRKLVIATADKVNEELEDGYFLQYSIFELFVNGTGRFVIGGPIGDSGEIGRKIVVDQAAANFSVGGGNLNAKYNHMDRIGAYAARYLAKNIVARGLADKCTVRLGYCIGVEAPTAVDIETYGTEHVTLQEIQAYANRMDLTPRGIRTKFRLERPIYAFSQVGHYGLKIRELLDGSTIVVPWEEIDNS